MLRTEKIYLRRLERADLERCHNWFSLPEIFVVMGVFGPRSKVEQERWYESISVSRTNLVFALCLSASDVHIGNVSLFDIDYINRNAGLTIFIGDQQYRGGGYGTDAIRILCDYAFDYLNMNRIYCKTDNPIAGRLYERLGFKHEGVLRKHAFHCGEYIDKHLYGVLRREYKSTYKET